MCPLNDNCSCHEDDEQDYGECAACGEWRRLTTRGNLYQHQKRQNGLAAGEQCEGAGKPPSRT